MRMFDILRWFFKLCFKQHKAEWWQSCPFVLFGGGGGTPSPPPAPSPGAATREAIEAEIDLLPQRLEAELEFRPRFAEVDIETLERFSPRIFELGRTAAREERALQEELFPEEVGVQRALGQKILGDIEGGIPGGVEEAFTERFRAEEARAGRLGSPVGSVNVARDLAGLSEGIRAQRVAEALSFSGRVPVVGSQQFSPTRPQAGPTLTGETVGAQLGLAGSIFGTQANIFGTQQQAATARRGQTLGLIGSGVGALGTVGGGFFGG